jgi:very-short-patch-repair endonuclease
LRAHRLQGAKFKRQQPIGPYIADFVCFDARLIVEVDGGQHFDSQADAQRDEWFRANGFRVMRFWNNQVLQETEAVLVTILGAMSKPPLPNPSPARGEGLESA